MKVVRALRRRRVSRAICGCSSIANAETRYRYASFNSRSDKLHKPQGISYAPGITLYHSSKCFR